MDIHENKFAEAYALGQGFHKLADVPEDIVIDAVVDTARVGVTT